MALLTLRRVIKCQWPDSENPPSKFKSYLFVQLVVKISLLFLGDFLRDLCEFTRPYAPNFIHFILSNTDHVVLCCLGAVADHRGAAEVVLLVQDFQTACHHD